MFNSQIKTILRYHFSPIRLAEIQKLDNTLCWEALLHTAGSYSKQYSFIKERNLAISNKSYICTYPEYLLPTIQRHMYIKIFVITSFVIEKYWKLLKCPSTGDWLNKPWSTTQLRKKIIYFNLHVSFFKQVLNFQDLNTH